ncbi:MAG: hypothetical protein IJY09_09845 [Lachnospiraceae bacterium]|nr:hypothetical protein [Lachnospiraceae bacterium]
MREKKIVICNNCGARMDKDAERCPHCHAMNYFGAEKKYMEGLEDIRENLHDLKDEAEEKRKKTVRTTVLVAIVVILVIAIPCAMLSLKGEQVADVSTKSYEEEFIKRLEWEDNYLPKMDEAYEEGDFEGVARIYSEHSSEEGSMAYYRWEHSKFMDFYNKYEKVLRYEEEGNSSYYWLSYAVELAGFWTEERLKEAINANYVSDRLSERDVEWIREFQVKAWEVLKNRGLSEAEVMDIAEQSTEDDYFWSSTCDRLLRERFEK